MKSIIYGFFCICLFANYLLAQQKDQNKKESLDAPSFQNKLKNTKDAVLLDVRTPEEVVQGKIPGATNIDFNSDDFKRKISGLDKNKTYFVYCAKGGRSSEAVDIMSNLGFKKLVNLEDGFTGWKENGLPVAQGK